MRTLTNHRLKRAAESFLNNKKDVKNKTMKQTETQLRINTEFNLHSVNMRSKTHLTKALHHTGCAADKMVDVDSKAEDSG